MERPISFDSEDIRDEKVSANVMVLSLLESYCQVKVLRAIPPIEPEDVLLGQYTAGNGKPGYLEDEGVPKESNCPTFACATMWINNPRWEGVPFILKAGKGLS